MLATIRLEGAPPKVIWSLLEHPDRSLGGGLTQKDDRRALEAPEAMPLPWPYFASSRKLFHSGECDPPCIWGACLVVAFAANHHPVTSVDQGDVGRVVARLGVPWLDHTPCQTLPLVDQ